jgi:hypothetical protein
MLAHTGHIEEDLGELQPFTTSYVRCDFKVVAEDEPRLIGFRVPKALEEKFSFFPMMLYQILFLLLLI